MKKRNKVILIIWGVLLFLVLLFGFTYAYFLANINGNTDESNVDVISEYLALQYDDGNGKIVASNILPGTNIASKTFSVENIGNGFIEKYVIVLEDVLNDIENVNDVYYTVTCQSNNTLSPCVGTEETVFPSENTIILENSLAINTTHSYTLNVYFDETNLDQSVDMGKTISGKINVYDKKSIVDIYGEIANVNEGDYVELSDSTKISTSQISSDNSYKFTGVLPGTYTMYVKDKDGNIIAERTIYINKGSEVDLDIDSLTIPEGNDGVNIDLDVDNGELNMDVKSVRDISSESGSLNYNILLNSIMTKNGTSLLDDSLSTPAENLNEIYSYNAFHESSVSYEPSLVNSTYQNYYWTYSDSISLNSSTGKITLVNPKTCKYSECYSSLVGKYTVGLTIDKISSSTQTLKTYKKLDKVYKITRADSVENSEVYFTTSLVYSVAKTGESSLVASEDNYSDSFYYRGIVNDNYVNFNGMCWRIVRILGDDSTKLVLEDKNALCNSSDYTGNWNIGSVNYGSSRIYQNNSTTFSFYANLANPTLNVNNSLSSSMKSFQDTYLSTKLNLLKNEGSCIYSNTYTDSKGVNLIDEEATTLESYYKSNTAFYYDNYTRLIGSGSGNYKPTLKCTNYVKKYSDGSLMYVGLLSVDEVIFAGAKLSTYNFNYYLANQFAIDNYYEYWTSSLSMYDKSKSYERVIPILSGGYPTTGIASQLTSLFRPTIVLKSGIQITSGDGTKSNPYVIDEG